MNGIREARLGDCGAGLHHPTHRLVFGDLESNRDVAAPQSANERGIHRQRIGCEPRPDDKTISRERA
jgi:hypothetical protein